MSAGRKTTLRDAETADKSNSNQNFGLTGKQFRPTARVFQQPARELSIENRIRFLGQRSDVPELMAASDIFCQPNLTPESFGIVFIEALYAGLPVVTTKTPTAVEILNAKYGMLVTPDVAAVQEALLRLIANADLFAHIQFRWLWSELACITRQRQFLTQTSASMSLI